MSSERRRPRIVHLALKVDDLERAQRYATARDHPASPQGANADTDGAPR